MDYIYHLANASLTLRVVEHLLGNSTLPLAFMTVIHQIDGWVIKVRLCNTVDASAMEEIGRASCRERV